MPLLVAGACIVSEPSCDPQLDAAFAPGVTFALFTDVVAETKRLVQDSAARAQCQLRAQQLGAAMQSNVQPVRELLVAAAAAAVTGGAVRQLLL
jgi:hypothetical protein